jgi:hypothetical protein
MIHGRLLNIRQELPLRRAKRQMTIDTAMAIKQATMLYLFCRGMRGWYENWGWYDLSGS